MDPQGKDSFSRAYNAWVVNRSPESMSDLVDAFMPTINAEIMQYSGPKELLRSRARFLVTQAIKSYNPMSGARLNSWIVTNLKQLSRYSKRLRPVRSSEVMIRNAAELATVEKRLGDDLGRKPTISELVDETGWSAKTISSIKKSSIPSVNGSMFDDNDEGDGLNSEPGLIYPDKVRYAAEAVYQGLSDRDKAIFDGKTGLHNKQQMSGTSLADMLNLSSAAISQRASSIGSDISDFARSNK